MSRPVGIRIAHDTARSGMVVVPVPQKSYGPNGFVCPTCNTWHDFKHVHLLLNDVGECLVSEGVLAELRLAGMPGLVVVGSVDNPPPLRLGGGRTRAQSDQENARITLIGGETVMSV